MMKCFAIGATVLFAWTAAAQEVPRVGVFLGYQYTRFDSSDSSLNLPGQGFYPNFSANGGSGQIIWNFNDWIGLVGDFGAVYNGNVARFGFDNTVTHFLGGPRLTFARWSRFRPYVQGLFGGAYSRSTSAIAVAPIDEIAPGIPGFLPGQTTNAILQSNQTKFALTAGGGLDIVLGRRVHFRPFGVDYYYTRFNNWRQFGDNNQNNLRATAGFVFLFGGEPSAPALPPTKTCPDGSVVPVGTACPKQNVSVSLTATPRELCPGERAQIVPSFSGATATQLTHSWSVNGQPVSQTPSFSFDSTGRAPGTYTVGLGVSGDEFNPASAETTVTVMEYRPPTGTAQANPASIQAGDRSTITARFEGQCGGPIQTATCTASEGSMSGEQFDSSSMQWGTSSTEQRRTVTITCRASDNRNTGSTTTTVEVVKAANIVPIRLPDVLFPANNSRVNNCGKRILLEQIRAYAQRDPNGTVVLVGHTSNDEASANLANQRAMNAAAVITAGTGVCLSIPQSQVQISAPGAEQNGVSFESGFCQGSVGAGFNEMRRVVVWFVPSGGTMPASVTNSQSAAAMGVSSLGCPK